MFQNPIYLNKAGWLSALSWQRCCWPASPVTLSRRVENAKRAGRGQTTPTCHWESSTGPWSVAENRGRSLGKVSFSKKTLTHKSHHNSVSKCMNLCRFTLMCHPAESELASQNKPSLLWGRGKGLFVLAVNRWAFGSASSSLDWVQKLVMDNEMGVSIPTAVCVAQCVHTHLCWVCRRQFNTCQVPWLCSSTAFCTLSCLFGF